MRSLFFCAFSALSLPVLARLTPQHFAPHPGAAADDVVTVPVYGGAAQPLNATSWNGRVPSTGRNFTGHVGILTSIARFSFELPRNGCIDHHATSYSADVFGCELATNGGFFEFPPNPACDGNLLINGSLLQWKQDAWTNFGVTHDGITVIGYMTEATYTKYGKFRTLMSGNGWLLRDGQSYVAKSRELNPNDTFVTEKAPRTGLGISKEGILFSLVVDGIEYLNEGVDLFEFAEIFQMLGAYHAVNVDGGGSSDAVLRGQVWSRPTCQDKPTPICERNVTSVICIGYK